MVLIILVNYNSYQDTFECISSLSNMSYQDYIVIIIDNASNINIHNLFDTFVFKNESTKVTYKDSVFKDFNILNRYKYYFVRSNENLGFAGGNNLGINFARQNRLNYDYIWLLNNDTVVDSNSLKYLVERMNYESSIRSNLGIIGAKLLKYHNPDKLQGVGGLLNKYTCTCRPLGDSEMDLNQYDNNITFDYPIGASLFLSKVFIDKVGLMNENYFLFFEELDWILEGKKHGFEYGCELNAKVYHKEGSSTQNNNNKLGLIADKCQVRNRLIFTYKFYPLYLITVIPSVYFTVIKRFVYLDFKRAITLFGVITKTIYSLLFKKHENY